MERIKYSCGHSVWIDHTPGAIVTVFDRSLCADCQRNEEGRKAPRGDFTKHVRKKG